MVEQTPFEACREQAEWDAERKRDQQTPEHQLERRWRLARQVVEYRAVRVDRCAPVADQDPAKVVHELHRQGPVEPELMVYLRDVRRARVWPRPADGRIARDDPGDHERQHDDTGHHH